MIRRAVASGLGRLSHKMKTEHFLTDMLPLLKNLVNDDQDSVRVLCVDSIIEISKAFSKELNKANIIPILIHMIRDKAWRVRIKLSNSYAQIAEAMSTEITDGSLLNIFSSLLADLEGEVRTAATQNFPALLKFVSPGKYSQLTSILIDLIKDTLPQVRVAAFEIMTIVLLHLPKDEVKSKLLDSILFSFKSEINNEVKIELVKALTSCGIAIGSDFYAKMTNNDLSSLLKEKNWRVRKEIYTMLAEVAVKVGSNQLFEVHFQEFFLSYLKDSAYQVRMHGNSLLAVFSFYPAHTVHRACQLGHPDTDPSPTKTKSVGPELLEASNRSLRLRGRGFAPSERTSRALHPRSSWPPQRQSP